jgi:hypothetical protein
MPREGIGRFAGKNEFSDVEFLEIFKELLPHVQSGEINLDKIKTVDMVEKMDSSFVHFGLNQAGKFFMESSNSGEVTADDYQQRFSHTFMSDYKAAFASLLENKPLQATLQKIYKKVGAIRYDAELFPVLTHTGDESGYITFVATKYDKAKFGTKGAFVVFKSWIKDENAQWTRPDPKKNLTLLNAIESADSAEWRIYTNEKHAKLSGVVKLKAMNVDKMLSTPEAIDDAIEVLKARGNTTIKAHLKNVIADLKEKLQGVLDKYAEETSSIFSKPDSPSSIEGVVLRIKKANGDIFEVKGTSNAFDTLKKQTWATRSSLAELEAVTEGSFLKDALGLKTAQAAALNRAIKEFGATFTSKEKNPEKREHEFLLKLFDAMKNQDAMVPPEETKKRVQQIFEVAKNQLSVIIDEFKSQNVDPDSKRKSMESLKAIIDKFDTIEKTISMDMPDEAFQLYIFKFMLDRRLKQYAGQHMNAAEQDYSKYYQGVTPVIIWNGRAQPWHRGHDAMIQLAKTKMEELGAEKILILIVKGGKTAQNKEENPLTEKDQKALIEAIYSDDKDVVVSDTPLANGSLFAIIQKLGEMKAYMVGWLAGDDRIEDYNKLLKSFNASVWLKDHATLPIKVNSKGVADVAMIETPRVMSGTAARESAKTSDFKTWLSNVAPQHSQKNKEAVGIYKQIYELLNSMKAESVLRNMIWTKFNESVVLNELHTDSPEKANLEIQKLIDAYTNESDPAKKQDILAKLEKRWVGGANDFIEKIDSIPDEKASPEVKEKSKEIYKKLADITSMANKKVGGNIEGPKGSDSETKNLPAPVEPDKLGYKVSDDEKQLLDKGGAPVQFKTTSTGLITVDNKPLALKSVDGKIKDVSPEEAKKKAEPEEQPEAQPESQSDNATDVEELKRSLRRYYFAKDPEEASKNIKAAVGAVAGAFTWMMKAENQKGGEAIDIMFSKIKDKYKEMEEKIKTGKVKANEINKLVADNAILFQKLIRTYRETKVAARKEFGNDDEFNKESARLRKSFANNNKELSDKSTKAMESAEVSGLRYVFKTLLKESSFSSHHQTLKKIMAKSDKLKDSKKILDSYIDEMVKAGINMQSIREFMNDDDVAKLLKNFLKKKTP